MTLSKGVAQSLLCLVWFVGLVGLVWSMGFAELVRLASPVATWRPLLVQAQSEVGSSSEARPLSQSPRHVTVISNQVRGSECCDEGSLSVFVDHLELARSRRLPTSFALRFDVLQDPAYRVVIQQVGSESQGGNESGRPQVEYGGFLEITPGLAAAAQVPYSGPLEQWYEAQQAYLIGYPQEDRRALIDTYMSAFDELFGEYPSYTVAWMIDPWSLNYLRQSYGVKVHQITREQFGTDSYTLYGGPPHLPYFPSPNWALVPALDQSSAKSSLPMIIRQTITDPVYNYGDTSNSFTSQPNDYQLRGDTLEYFQHLFFQAHEQVASPTFALIGLENSMPEVAQEEFGRQLAVVQAWQSAQPGQNQVLLASQVPEVFGRSEVDVDQALGATDDAQESSSVESPSVPRPWLHVYAGTSLWNKNEQAVWITTAWYRARVRLSAGEVFVSDLRLYSEAAPDPYQTESATKLGWWITPFLVDGSRFFNQEGKQVSSLLHGDTLENRPNSAGTPSRITLVSQPQTVFQKLRGKRSEGELQLVYTATESPRLQILYKGQTVADFSATGFSTVEPTFAIDVPQLQPVLEQMVDQLVWRLPASNLSTNQGQSIQLAGGSKTPSLDREPIWGVKLQPSSTGQDWQPWMTTQATESVQLAREQFPRLLFPEVSLTELSPTKSRLDVHNQFAIADRNPVRLIFFPQNRAGQPVYLEDLPTIEVADRSATVRLERPHGSNGMVFIDVASSEALQTDVSVASQGFSKTVRVYFAPDCKKSLRYCLTHPRQAWWYLQTKVRDWLRET